ncbi:hypothetical protein CYMTET_12136 [Cymbomonas tetramitiformis]|uniref:PDZ domain-containing protein n=1 Tax=Cymbomonas tetramitiformis TaxID=36881 RepID=A0AAE0LCR6_9CHLO|nr:hypothetical protein CYMTET_12136 [Cymbomonas tetramitiformis]
MFVKVPVHQLYHQQSEPVCCTRPVKRSTTFFASRFPTLCHLSQSRQSKGIQPRNTGCKSGLGRQPVTNRRLHESKRDQESSELSTTLKLAETCTAVLSSWQTGAVICISAAAFCSPGAQAMPLSDLPSLSRPAYVETWKRTFGERARDFPLTVASISAPPVLSTTPNRDAYDESMFTTDAWQGMLKLKEYATLLEEIEKEETECGDICTGNREYVEEAWQIVATEYYDARNTFSQTGWVDALTSSMRAHGGVLYTREQAYDVVRTMMLTLGDKYSELLKPSAYRSAIRRPREAERKYLAAQYVGVGVQLGAEAPEGGLVVDAPLAGSPAEEAGVLAGERLLAVDGVPVGPGITAQGYTDVPGVERNVTLDLLRGPAGSRAVLTIGAEPSSEAGEERALEVRKLLLERRALPLPAVTSRMLGDEDRKAMYIRAHYFSSATTAAVKEAVEHGTQSGVKGYVLDLRNNPGGVFEEALATAAGLMPPCKAATTDPQAGCDLAYTVRARSSAGADVVDNTFNTAHLSPRMFPLRPESLTQAPVVVLVNRSSASAAEVLAGALKDNERAVLIGEHTFGKGVIQYYFPVLQDGSGLKLTVAKYLTPGGHDITAEGGLDPDLICHDYPRAPPRYGLGHSSSAQEHNDTCIMQALSVIMRANDV